MNIRKPEYLSPSALMTYNKSPEEYYIRYLAPSRAPRMEQTREMAVGSSFDAFIKSHLYESINGRGHDPKYELKALFESQVSAPNRDAAWEAGAYIFSQYQKTGCIADLLLEMDKSVTAPQFEFEVRGKVSRDSGWVVLLGKPDIRFINAQGAEVIYDWKVSGYYGKGNTSPAPGYIQCRNGWTSERSGPHKNAVLGDFKGIQINTNAYLENVKVDWALQLATYGWLLGSNVGAEIVVGIDQVACKNNGTKFPDLRFANHRLRISEQYQYSSFDSYVDLWNKIYNEPFHFFHDVSLEDSQARCEALNKQAELLGETDLDSDISWALNLGRVL